MSDPFDLIVESEKETTITLRLGHATFVINREPDHTWTKVEDSTWMNRSQLAAFLKDHCKPVKKVK